MHTRMNKSYKNKEEIGMLSILLNAKRIPLLG
jgi:hypothetical protein